MPYYKNSLDEIDGGEDAFVIDSKPVKVCQMARANRCAMGNDNPEDAKWEYHDCLMLGDKGYLGASVQQNLFDVANITLEVPYRLNQKNWRPLSWAYKKFRKRIETVFSQLNDQFMMIRNYAKQTCGLFTRKAAKIGAMTVLQYVNFCNHRPLGQVKYASI